MSWRWCSGTPGKLSKLHYTYLLYDRGRERRADWHVFLCLYCQQRVRYGIRYALHGRCWRKIRPNAVCAGEEAGMLSTLLLAMRKIHRYGMADISAFLCFSSRFYFLFAGGTICFIRRFLYELKKKRGCSKNLLNARTTFWRVFVFSWLILRKYTLDTLMTLRRSLHISQCAVWLCITVILLLVMFEVELLQ